MGTALGSSLERYRPTSLGNAFLVDAEDQIVATGAFVADLAPATATDRIGTSLCIVGRHVPEPAPPGPGYEVVQ